jgi:hypothetical protein
MFGKTLNLIGLFGVRVILFRFRSSLQIFFRGSRTKFWLLFTFEVLNIVFFGKTFDLIGSIGVTAIIF